MDIELPRPYRDVLTMGDARGKSIPWPLNRMKDDKKAMSRSLRAGSVKNFSNGLEKNGYVRGVGLGPNPSELELLGTQKYTSKKLQMEIEARRLADQQADHMQEQMDEMKQQMDEMREMLLAAHDAQNTNSTPRYGSNTPPQSMRVQQHGHEEAIHDDEAQSSAYMENLHSNEDMNLKRRASILERENQQEGGGRDVILYNINRPYETVVAKGMIQTTNPSAIVGGERLGPQYYEVVINYVFRMDIELPRPSIMC